MAKYNTRPALEARAHRKARELGHDLGIFEGAGPSIYARCRLCRGQVIIRTDPGPWQERVIGEALVLHCPVRLQRQGLQLGPLEEEAVLREGLVMGYFPEGQPDTGAWVTVGYDWKEDCFVALFEDGVGMRGRYWAPILSWLGTALTSSPRWKAIACVTWAGAGDFHRARDAGRKSRKS